MNKEIMCVHYIIKSSFLYSDMIHVSSSNGDG